MTILVVDDEQFVSLLFRQRFRKELRDGAFDFAFAHSGGEALQILAAQGASIRLVLTDLKMPGMSGFELLAHIRQTIDPAPDVYMMTAYDDAARRRDALARGAAGYITKPIDFDALSRLFMQQSA